MLKIAMIFLLTMFIAEIAAEEGKDVIFVNYL